MFEGSVDSNVVINCFDLFAQSLEKETWIVLDNAPIHRSEEFEVKDRGMGKPGIENLFFASLLSEFEQDRNVMAENQV